ncbi:Putative sodium-dependent multivitamin transporter [Gryllus bimaculatus]|nr:Putative sodium-dependent multivitamin transporter [Gryllus bimaculatus]
MFCSMLLISTVIGIYFGCFGSRQKSGAEYLLGGRNMSVLPVAVSLIARCYTYRLWFIYLLLHSVKIVAHQDQLLPYYVMDITQQIPGLPGLFVAGVFSAALSTMSTCLNSIAGTIFEDFVAPCLSQKRRETQASLFMKIIVVFMGIFCVVMVLLVEKLGGAVQGALTGGLTSLIFVSILVVGSQTAIASKQLLYEKKPVSVDGCHHLFNSTMERSNHFNYVKNVPIKIQKQQDIWMLLRYIPEDHKEFYDVVWEQGTNENVTVVEEHDMTERNI